MPQSTVTAYVGAEFYALVAVSIHRSNSLGLLTRRKRELVVTGEDCIYFCIHVLSMKDSGNKSF